MSEYTENSRVVAILPNPVRDRLFEAASEKGYTTSHLLRELVIKELDRLDEAKTKAAA